MNIRESSNQSRRLRIEALEDRRLLAVTAAEFAAIRETYPTIELSAKMGDYNLIELTDLTAASLRNALTDAAETTKDDLIVIRTTGNKNTITLTGTEILVDVPATKKGSVAIVGFGETPLMIDANELSRIFRITNESDVVIAGVHLKRGFAEDEGGAILLESGTLHLDSSVVYENTASGGAGIDQSATALLYVTNSTFHDNTALLFGGGAIRQYGPSLTILNTTFADNRSASNGGALFSFPDVGDTLEIVNCTFVANSALRGGAIAAFDADATLYNSLLYDNECTDAIVYDNLIFVDANHSVKYTLLENSPASLGLASGKDGNLLGVDPLLGIRRQSVSGQLYYPLKNQSPAIDAGSNPLFPTALLQDQIGNTRIQDDVIDLGAVEFMPPEKPKAVIANAKNLSIQQGCSLRLSAAGSVDPIGKGFTYTWDFSGKGVFTETVKPEIWFDAMKLKSNAYHTVSLKVRDAEGNESAITTANVYIRYSAPCFSATTPEDGIFAAETSQWSFTAQDVGNQAIMHWSIYWGDGTAKTEISGGPRNHVTVFHDFGKSVQYAITVTTTDFAGVSTTVTFAKYSVLKPVASGAATPEVAEPAQIAVTQISPEESFLKAESPRAEEPSRSLAHDIALSSDFANKNVDHVRFMLEFERRTTETPEQFDDELFFDSIDFFESDFAVRKITETKRVRREFDSLEIVWNDFSTWAR